MDSPALGLPPPSVSWRTAMSRALYGERGFYLAGGGPARHFRTSAHVNSAWATAVATLAARIEDSLGAPADFTVVDVGAGGGELLAGLAAIAPAHWRLIGVDVAQRPVPLAARIEWLPETPAGLTGLLLANELLDVVPLDVAILTADGPRMVTVDASGEESAGGHLSEPDLAWQRRWWPLRKVGDRAELGATRDLVWRALAGQVERGVAVAIDYAAIPDRDCGGTLTGYRNGRQVAPVPDGTCDLTAHVLFDSLVADGALLVSQRDALCALGLNAHRPAYAGDPTSYLAELSASGDAAELIDPRGLGTFTWLVRSHDVEAPIRLRQGPC